MSSGLGDGSTASIEFRGLNGDKQARRQSLPRLAGLIRRAQWVSLVMMAAGGVGAVVSPFLLQIRVAEGGTVQTVDGWGRFRIFPANSSIGGHGPALGASAFAAGILVLALIVVTVVNGRKELADTALLVCSGIVVATLACQVIAGYGYSGWSWGSGLYLLAASAVALLVGSVVLMLDHGSLRGTPTSSPTVESAAAARQAINSRQWEGDDQVDVVELDEEGLVSSGLRADDEIEWRPRRTFGGLIGRAPSASFAMLALGGIGAVVSPFLPQVSRGSADGPAMTINGWGFFHRVGTSSNGNFYGHGPALEGVAFGAGILILVLVVVAAVHARNGPAYTALVLFGGVVVGTLACQVADGYEYADWSWAIGLWLLAASAAALVAGSATLTLDHTSLRARPSSATVPSASHDD